MQNISEIRDLCRQYEDPLKTPPTYYYLEPRVAFIFVVTRVFVQNPITKSEVVRGRPRGKTQTCGCLEVSNIRVVT